MSAASAFASRKAVKPAPELVPQQSEQSKPNDVEVVDNALQRPPRKKRRKQKEIVVEDQKVPAAELNGAPSHVSERANHVQVNGADVGDNNLPLNQVPESQSSDDSNGADGIKDAPVSRQLCTFQPSSENVLIDTKAEWAVRLGRRDASILLLY